MCIVAFVDLVAPAALSPPQPPQKLATAIRNKCSRGGARDENRNGHKTEKLTWAWRLQRLSERRFRVCNAEGCRLNTGLPSTSTAKRISVPSGHPSSDNVDNVPSTHTSITVRAASAGVGRRRSAAWLLVVSSGTSSAASTIATTAAPTAATLPPLPFPAPPLLPLLLVLNPEWQTREEEEEQGTWNHNSVGDCDMCDCRRKDLLLELRKRMAEFDDNPFRSSSMCVCVCVCASTSTNIPATKIGSKEAPESCEAHEHHSLASLQIRVPFPFSSYQTSTARWKPSNLASFFSRPRFPVLAGNSQTTRKQVRAQQHHKKVRQPTQFLTISSTNSISYNFFNRLNVTEFLQNTISLTNSKAQFYTFFKKFKTWISSMCIFHLQTC
jgi:hypothetical protein